MVHNPWPNQYKGSCGSIFFTSKTTGVCGSCHREIEVNEVPKETKFVCPKCHRALDVLNNSQTLTEVIPEEEYTYE